MTEKESVLMRRDICWIEDMGNQIVSIKGLSFLCKHQKEQYPFYPLNSP